MAIYNCISKPNNNFAEKFRECPESEVRRRETGDERQISITLGYIRRKTNKKSKKGCPKTRTTF